MRKSHDLLPIAIVDDDSSFRFLLQKYVLRSAACSVIMEAGDGIECINNMERAETKPAIIILDIAMQPMGGFEAIKILKARWPGVKVLVLSVHCRDYCLHFMLHHGANAFLSKESLPDIPCALLYLKDHEVYFSELVTQELYTKIRKRQIKIPEMTPKEMEILRCLNTDLVNKEITDKLAIHSRTLEKHLEHLYQKFSVNSRSGLLNFAFKHEMLAT